VHNWKAYDRVLAKLPNNPSFIDQVIMHRKSKERKMKKLHAVILIQQCICRWKTRRIELRKAEEQRRSAMKVENKSKEEKLNMFNENDDEDVLKKQIGRYIDHKVQKHLEMRFSSSWTSSNEQSADWNKVEHSFHEDVRQHYSNEVHHDNLKHDKKLRQLIDLQIQEKADEHVSKHISSISPSRSINNYDQHNNIDNATPQGINLLHMDDLERANSENGDSLSTVTTNTTYNNKNYNNNNAFFKYSMGDSVMATHDDWSEIYYPGHIAGFNVDGTYAVQFLDGDFSPSVSIKHLRREDQYGKNQLSIRNMRKNQNISDTIIEFVPGEAILATHSNWDNGYFPGRVEKLNNDGTYVIHFHDGDIAYNVEPNHIKGIPFQRKDRVMGKEDHWVDMHKGTIERLNSDGTYTISFDDGDLKDILLKNIRRM
jgi:hypothetical protein